MSNIDENKIENQHLTDYQMSVAADALIDGRYSQLDNEISRHIEICTSCKSDLFSVVDTLTQMDTEFVKEIEEPTGDKNISANKFQWSKWLVAASIISLIITSITFWQKSNEYQSDLIVLQDKLDGIGQDPIIKLNDSLELEIKKQEQVLNKIVNVYSDSLDKVSNRLESTSKLLAESYSVNPTFERQIKTSLRSTSIKVNSSKHIEKNYGSEVSLSWESQSPSTSIAIYNNKGLLVIKESGLKNKYILESNLLTPGVYYWKLIGEEGVVFIGKITLK